MGDRITKTMQKPIRKQLKETYNESFEVLPEEIKVILRTLQGKDQVEYASPEKAEAIVRTVADYFGVTVTNNCGYLTAEVKELPFVQKFRTNTGWHSTRYARIQSPNQYCRDQSGKIIPGLERSRFAKIQFVRYHAR